MTIEQLEYALAVFQHGTFVKAAAHSFVTQPALTIQIKNLEEELGITIFDRSKKPVLVTEEGKIFLEKAQYIVMGIRDLQLVSEQLHKDFKGEVKLGVIITLAPYLVPLFVNQLNEKYPDIHLQVIELTTEDIIDRIKTGELDAGIIATPVHGKGMNTEVLFYEKFFFYVTEQHPLFARHEIRLEEIPLDDIWLLSEGNCFRNQVNDICKIEKPAYSKRAFSYTSSSIESLKRIVEHKGGLTVIPELATLNISEEKEKMIKSVAGPQPVREISLVTNRAYVKRKLLDKVKEVIWQNLPSSMRSADHKMVVDTNITF